MNIISQTNLRQLRTKEKKTQEEVARDLHITRNHYSMIETGKRNPSLRLAIRIANYFGKPFDDVFN